MARFQRFWATSRLALQATETERSTSSVKGAFQNDDNLLSRLYSKESFNINKNKWDWDS
jgi:hypothetical protein